MKSPFPANVVFATSNKSHGNMSFMWGEKQVVKKNRETFLNANNVPIERYVQMQVSHQDTITIVDRGSAVEQNDMIINAEALITNQENTALFLVTADCLPVTIYDPVHKVIALAHLGWKPTDLRLLQKVIMKMEDSFLSQAKDLHVNIGPCIHRESYVLEEILQNGMGWQPYIELLPSGKKSVDLVAYNKAQMQEIGVLTKNIFADPHDTAISKEYFSHYRSVRTGEPEGRFATIFMLKA